MSKPKIADFSGPTATVQNSEALVTSNKARQRYDLPLMTNLDGAPIRCDAIRPQRLAAIRAKLDQYQAIFDTY